MADKTVTVTFTPGTPPTWSFDKNSVTMNASGNINFHQASGSSGWEFTNFAQGNSQFGTPQISNNGKNMVVSNAFTTMGNFCYTVSVSAGGAPYTSPDPEIVNQPPTPK